MKKLNLILNLILFCTIIKAQNIDGPESVVYDTLNNRYLVSSLNNGKIVAINGFQEQTLIQNLNSNPFGNCIHQNYFYTSSPIGVFKMNLINDSIEKIFVVPNSQQMDGLAVDKNNNLFVVDGLAKKIFKINLQTEAISVFISDNRIDMAQDIYFDTAKDLLYMVAYKANSPVYAINPQTAEMDTLISATVGNLDGISMDNERNLYISSYSSGEVWIYDSTFANPPQLFANNYSGCSGIDFNKTDNVLAIPVFNEDRIEFIEKDFSDIIFQESVAASFNEPAGIYLSDIDNDGFTDIIAASSGNGGVSWFKNDGTTQTNWAEHAIDSILTNALSVYAGFIDNDTLKDLVTASMANNEVAWHRNNGGSPITWTKHIISTNANGAHEVFLYDINKDGFLDVLAAAATSNKILVWYNSGGSNPNWTAETIDSNAQGARSVSASDLDNDGNIDIVSASLTSNELTWYRNDSGIWTEISIDNNYKLAHRVFLTDMDDDDDLDILGCAYQEINISWWENVTSDTTYWIKHTIADNFGGQVIAQAADFNGDGQKDIVATSQGLHDIKWYRNDTYRNNENWKKFNLNTNFTGVWPLYFADIDNDNDLDIVAGGNNANQIRVWKNSLFENQTHAPKAIISKSNFFTYPGGTITFESKSIGNIDSLKWVFSENAIPVNASGAGPHEIQFNEVGQPKITLIAYNDVKNDTCFTTIIVDTTIHLNISPKNPTICAATPFLMKVSGADSVHWEPATFLNNNIGNVVVCTPTNNITYTVTGYFGINNKSITQQINLINLSYDNVCNAKLLNIGLNLNLTNACATVEPNEPNPPLTGCTGQHSWCPEGGLQNSVWFKFVAPTSGHVKINTSGFDNQIALYDADSCIDILNGNFSILYANDDFNPDASAQITSASGLTPGKTYWLQLDGSAGGAVGTFFITITSLTGLEENLNESKFKIIPNPNDGSFNIILGPQDKEFGLRIYDTKGILVYSKITTDKRFALTHLKNGLYHLRITMAEGVYNQKMVIQK